MKVLITGFDPFGGEKINPAYEAVIEEKKYKCYNMQDGTKGAQGANG